MSDKGDIIINEISEKIYEVLDLENNSCPLNINEDKVFDEIQEIGLKEIGLSDFEISNIIDKQNQKQTIQKGGVCDDPNLKEQSKIILNILSGFIWNMLFSMINYTANEVSNYTRRGQDLTNKDQVCPIYKPAPRDEWNPFDPQNYQLVTNRIKWVNIAKLVFCIYKRDTVVVKQGEKASSQPTNKLVIITLIKNIFTHPIVLVKKLWSVVSKLYEVYGCEILNINKENFDAALKKINKLEVSNIYSSGIGKFTPNDMINVLLESLNDIICEFLKIGYSEDIENHEVNIGNYGEKLKNKNTPVVVQDVNIPAPSEESATFYAPSEESATFYEKSEGGKNPKKTKKYKKTKKGKKSRKGKKGRKSRKGKKGRKSRR